MLRLSRRHALLLGLSGSVFVVVVVVDQVSKFLSSHVILNTGFSGQLLAGFVDPLAMTGVFVVLVGALGAVWGGQPGQWPWLAAFSAAAFSNLVDRWLYGGVRDVFPLPFGWHNNFADWVLVVVAIYWAGKLMKQAARQPSQKSD